MARKTKTEDIHNIEKVVTPLKLSEVKEIETVNIAEAKAEPIKYNTVIAKTSVPFRSKASIEHKFIVGQMPIGISYQIIKEVESLIFGNFYLLSNGYYITKDGNYIIN